MTTLFVYLLQTFLTSSQNWTPPDNNQDFRKKEESCAPQKLIGMIINCSRQSDEWMISLFMHFKQNRERTQWAIKAKQKAAVTFRSFPSSMNFLLGAWTARFKFDFIEPSLLAAFKKTCAFLHRGGGATPESCWTSNKFSLTSTQPHKLKSTMIRKKTRVK